jgi:hypothetical protein
MREKNSVVSLQFGLVLSLAVGIAGCADLTANLEDPQPTTIKKVQEVKPNALAGVDKDVSKSMSPDRMKGLIASTARFGARGNPFALSGEEIRFDELQASERFLSESGHFPNSFELPEDKDDVFVAQEEQPYRRISGIVIGDAVYAILEENGRSTIIRPGTTIPDTNWVVVAIDRDGVTLRRSGNIQPNEVIVRLEVAPPGMGGTPYGGGVPGGGGPTGGRPGGLPGGGGAAGADK